MLRTNTKPHQLIKHAKISYSIASIVFLHIFVRYLPKWSKPRYRKAEALLLPQKVQTVTV